jgi:hypothetical protein
LPEIRNALRAIDPRPETKSTPSGPKFSPEQHFRFGAPPAGEALPEARMVGRRDPETSRKAEKYMGAPEMHKGKNREDCDAGSGVRGAGPGTGIFFLHPHRLLS